MMTPAVRSFYAKEPGQETKVQTGIREEILRAAAGVTFDLDATLAWIRSSVPVRPPFWDHCRMLPLV